jgi:hypothetical protein
VSETVHSFIEAHVRSKREQVRAIIVIGEASDAAIAELGEIALKMVGTEAVRLIKDIDAKELVAYGAAIWARMTQQTPERFESPQGNIIPDDEEWARMLEKRRIEERDEL